MNIFTKVNCLFLVTVVFSFSFCSFSSDKEGRRPTDISGLLKDLYNTDQRLANPLSELENAVKALTDDPQMDSDKIVLAQTKVKQINDLIHVRGGKPSYQQLKKLESILNQLGSYIETQSQQDFSQDENLSEIFKTMQQSIKRSSVVMEEANKQIGKDLEKIKSQGKPEDDYTNDDVCPSIFNDCKGGYTPMKKELAHLRNQMATLNNLIKQDEANELLKSLIASVSAFTDITPTAKKGLRKLHEASGHGSIGKRQAKKHKPQWNDLNSQKNQIKQIFTKINQALNPDESEEEKNKLFKQIPPKLVEIANEEIKIMEEIINEALGMLNRW